MSLKAYNYGHDSAWAKQNQTDYVNNNDSHSGREQILVNGSRQKESPKNSPKLQGQKDVKEPVLAASQYVAKINFLLEHLSSFTLKNFQESQVPPRDRLQQTKILLANGNQWTKEMEMRLTDSDVVLLDGETQDVIEVFPLSTIGHVHHFSDDPDLNSVLVFNTIQTEHKFGAVHLFQSDRVPAAVVATEIMKASSSIAAMPNKFASRGGVMLPPPPIHPAPAPPQVDQERLDLYEKSLVAQTIAAFSAVSENTDKKTSKPQITSRYQASESSDIPDDTLSAEILEARTNRDVQILNHCIDDIENLIMQTKRSAEAWKKLQKKKGKNKRNSLSLEARPPPEGDFFDAFQKLKHAFNLLAKLKQHIHNPSAAELVHYLFVPLTLLIRCTGGPQRAGAVVTPLLSSQTLELLENCLSLKEKEVWKALGPNWNMTKSSPQFKDQFFPPYTPVFKDGWLPPYVIAGKDVSNVSAAIAANAAAVAQLNDEQRKGEDSLSNPTVLSAAAKFRLLGSAKKSEDSVPTSPTKKGLRRVRVLFDFQARNSKELTVHRGEEVAVLLDSRQWWCVRNSEGAIGFVPNTIVEESGTLPSPPTIAPPSIPTSQVTVTQAEPKKTEISQVSSSRPRPEDDGGVPRVELRPVRLGKLNRPVSAPPVGQLVMPPAPPSNPPPSPPSSTSTTITPAPLAIVTSNGTVEKEAVNKTTEVSDFTKAIQAKNLKKVDAEAEKKRGREDTQQNKKSSTDKINDELKRRMTSSQDGVTPRTQRKESQQVVNLSPDSKAGEVKKWLISKGFSESCVAALSKKTAKDLDSMTKDQVKQLCGEAEGSRVFSQFSVQKANWEVVNKGSELELIMKKRKERSEVESEVELENGGELRTIVADAKLAAREERLRTSSVGKKPATKPTSHSKNQGPPPETKARPSRATQLKESSEGSFDSTEFIPPPPVVEAEDKPRNDDGERNQKEPEKASSQDEVDKLLLELRKQQELLVEHDNQRTLLEQLQRQKLELEQQKHEFEQLQQRRKQAELEDQQRELQRQIQAQQDQLKLNEERLIEQKRFLSTNYDNAPQKMTYAAIPPVMQQLPLMPLGNVPAPQYLPMGGMQPVYTSYTGPIASTGMPHVIPTLAVPPVTTTQPPM